MANHKNPIPEWLNEEYMAQAFQKFYKNPTVTVKQISISAGSSVGDNYLGQIIRIKTDLKIDGKISQKSVIGKLIQDTKTVESLKDQIDVFQVEADFFSLLLPKLQEVIVNIDPTRKIAPDCYFVDYERKIILMEDMMEKGFSLQNRKSFLTKEQALLVLTKHASFHGASYKALQEKPEFKDIFKHSLFASQKNDMVDHFLDNYEGGIKKHSHSYNLSEDRIQKMRDISRKIKKVAFKFCSLEEGKLNFLLHGDCWKSNMLFHTSNEKLDDVILLDFQGVTHNCFANDLNYFLFSSVSADVLINNLDELLEHYYYTLKAVAPEIPDLSFERIKKEFQDRLLFGMVMFCTFRPMLLRETPMDIEAMIDGDVQDDGFGNKAFISDLQKVFPLFDKVNIF